MKTTLKAILACSALLVTGCATKPTAAAMGIKDADASMVKGCKFVGAVTGTSGFGNLAAKTGIDNSKNEARDQAAHMGATHIVWTSVSGAYSSSATGNAYRCK